MVPGCDFTPPRSRGLPMTAAARFVVAISIATFAVGLGVSPAWAQQAKAKKQGEAKPPPDLTNVSYGPHERNVMDVWKAKSDRPTPLLVFIHGGGFRGGSKEAVQAYLLTGCLASGISVVSINYR